MKALTLTEPWASLVALGAKRIETRSWWTGYRGEIAIHAAKTMTGDDLAFAQDALVSEVLMAHGRSIFPHAGFCGLVKDAFSDTRGKVIATARLVACCRMVVGQDEGTGTAIGVLDLRRKGDHRFRPIPEKELPFGHYDEGRFAWILTDVELLAEPIPARGALGLWEWDPPADWRVAS